MQKMTPRGMPRALERRQVVDVDVVGVRVACSNSISGASPSITLDADPAQAQLGVEQHGIVDRGEPRRPARSPGVEVPAHEHVLRGAHR